MEIGHVEVINLLGVTLDCELSWSNHIDATVAKMGRSRSIIKCCSSFLPMLSTRHVLQALVLSYLDCPVVWSDDKNIIIGPEQGSTAGLKCTQRANNTNIYVNLSRLKV